MSTRDVINRYYELAAKGDWDTWCDLFAVDTVMDEQLAGHVEGRETLRDMMRGFPQMYAEFANTPVHVVVDGEQAAVVSHISGRTHSGITIEAEVCNYFRVVGEEIVYMANFHDSVPFAPVLGK
ncbi:nuclear transport factor 2 family protein [Kitasatospora sp. LaBMicrA B282]|uniref:nuclear transport factor 2 family protein n=1 Tax=Kitasatospora sp. LaBMicrA B282 TaxID=3420949 RepID=UPI003D0B2705